MLIMYVVLLLPLVYAKVHPIYVCTHIDYYTHPRHAQPVWVIDTSHSFSSLYSTYHAKCSTTKPFPTYIYPRKRSRRMYRTIYTPPTLSGSYHADQYPSWIVSDHLCMYAPLPFKIQHHYVIQPFSVCVGKRNTSRQCMKKIIY